MSTEEYVDQKIAELGNALLEQIRDLADRIASLRGEVRELRLRNEKLESGARAGTSRYARNRPVLLIASCMA